MDNDLRTFWARLSVAMGVVLVAAISQTVDVSTMPYTGLPPVGPRTLTCYVIATILGSTALLRLPGGGSSWRQLTTAVLDVAVVAVTGAIAASEYLGWFVHSFKLSASAWWLSVAIMAIAGVGAVVIVKIMAARRSPVPRAALWWLAPIGLAGPLSTVLMTMLEPWPHLNGSAAVLPFVGLFGVLAARAQQRGAGTPGARVLDLSSYRRGTAIPLVATGLVSVLVATVFLRTGHLGAVQVTGTTCLLLLVVARQTVTLAENGTLLDTVAHQAMHDELTGLHSRRYFTAALTEATDTHTVLLIDLKDFRAVNDGLGPAVGDALLIAYGRRLRALAGEGAVVARLGGDEFGLLVPGAADLSSRVLAANAEPLDAAGHEVLVEVSIGIATSAGTAGPSRGGVPAGVGLPGAGISAGSGLLAGVALHPTGCGRGSAYLYRQAEIALREAASGAGDRVVRYDASLEQRLSQRATIAADLRRALGAGEFHLLYQPIVRLPHGTVAGVESLIRWTPADGRTVSPADFIPVAEDTGLIVELGAWIIDTVCAQAAQWLRRHGQDALRSIAVNVSARQLLDPNLPEVVASALARHGVPANRLTIEITETAVFAGGRALTTVQALSQLGVNLALDDFGTGHSSLGLLRTCPVNAIKVDKSFVDGLGGTPQQEAIAIAVHGIAERMGLYTVAEGVETAAQARRLHELGYRHAQGFHFAPPLPAAGIDALLEENSRLAA
ncbi:putative bifunctional diguanylate cyclase/phosphodiesterase [Actinoplanes siamensis]|uniref:putative bifunctional diguanylate cyclase/phosphodiesterase n=1 Tax=Actinoplanes siamensis TaxID=1223317 RepID=UPI003612B602